jgi:hypothetical protein
LSFGFCVCRVSESSSLCRYDTLAKQRMESPQTLTA